MIRRHQLGAKDILPPTSLKLIIISVRPTKTIVYKITVYKNPPLSAVRNVTNHKMSWSKYLLTMTFYDYIRISIF